MRACTARVPASLHRALQGYTSLGSLSNTIPNPALRNPDGTFRPAHALQDGALERQGRTSGKHSSVASATVEASQDGGLRIAGSVVVAVLAAAVLLMAARRKS